MRPVHLGAAAALALAAVQPAAQADPLVCVKWWTQVIASMPGYNHVVVIDNQCDQKVACRVSTDVAPDAITASVAGKERAELITFRGSPAREFKAKVDCRPE